VALDPGAFRAVMSRLAAGVTIVTVRDGGGALGMTASSVTSVSLEPPMLLVCVACDARLHEPILAAERFGVSVLSADQRAVAERFAVREQQHWTPSGPSSPAGLPLIEGALAHLDCRRAGVFPGGDHSIVTGIVEWASGQDGSPLCFFRSSYTRLAP
jgi:flavin reductase (DIM6/NTAB) family NADH-FMN oxidoreductase RutF